MNVKRPLWQAAPTPLHDFEPSLTETDMTRLILITSLCALPSFAAAMPKGHFSTLTIFSDENRENCNDGYYWDAKEKMCIADTLRR